MGSCSHEELKSGSSEVADLATLRNGCGLTSGEGWRAQGLHAGRATRLTRGLRQGPSRPSGHRGASGEYELERAGVGRRQG